MHLSEIHPGQRPGADAPRLMTNNARSAILATFVLLTAIISAAIVGCSAGVVGDGDGDRPTSGNDGEENHATVRVLYATDRKRTGNLDPGEMYGSDRSGLSYGTCDVSIPRDHRMGELESPSIWRLEFRENPEKHVVLLRAVPHGEDRFYSAVSQTISSSDDHHAFIFVHGYNVTFEDAARRTAQVAYDLGFDGAPVFYSWPSNGTEASYTWDWTAAEWTKSHFRAFLADFIDRSEAEKIFLIAHSMGSVVVTHAVTSLLNDDPALQDRVSEIILAAPDIDADVFKHDLAPAMIEAGLPVTLYASSEDVALIASHGVHGAPRAGDAGSGLVIVAGVETIDATGIDTSFVGHSYWQERRSVLADIFYLLREGHRANDRFGLDPIETTQGRYWKFRR